MSVADQIIIRDSLHDVDANDYFSDQIFASYSDLTNRWYFHRVSGKDGKKGFRIMSKLQGSSSISSRDLLKSEARFQDRIDTFLENKGLRA